MSDSESEALYRQLDAAQNNFHSTFKPEHEESVAPTNTRSVLTTINNLTVDDIEMDEPTVEPAREPAREIQTNSPYIVEEMIDLTTVFTRSRRNRLMPQEVEIVLPLLRYRQRNLRNAAVLPRPEWVGRSERVYRATRPRRSRLLDPITFANRLNNLANNTQDVEYVSASPYYGPTSSNAPNMRGQIVHVPRPQLPANQPTQQPLVISAPIDLDSSTTSDGTINEEPFVISEEFYNPIMIVKLMWKSVNEKHIKIKRFTPLARIVEIFATRENVDSSYLKFFIKDKPVDLTKHSCATLCYMAPQIPVEIEGSVSTNNNPVLEHQTGPLVQIKLQNNRKIETVDFPPDMRMEILYAIAVIRFTFPIGSFKVIYDGKRVSFNSTINMLGAEEGDCFDVMQI